MNKKEAEKVAAFLREYLKQGKEAITVVMTRDIVLSLYTLAERISESEEERTKMYTADATLSDGRHITITGTITDCANWADNIIRSNDGSIKIDIRKMEDEK